MHRAVGEIDRGIFAPGGYGSIPAQVLGGGGQAGGGAQVLALEAARFRRGKLRGDPGVFTRALDDPTPAWIARYIEHGREGERNSILRSFRGGAACRSLPGVRIEQAGLRQRHREDRAMTVDDIEAQQQWNPESGILDCDPLQGAHLLGAPEVQHVADASGTNALIERAALARAGDDAGCRDHVELPDPLLERHRGEQSVDTSHALALL